jgi:hypothetical protein
MRRGGGCLVQDVDMREIRVGEDVAAARTHDHDLAHRA